MSFHLTTSNGGVDVVLIEGATIHVISGESDNSDGTFDDVREGRSAVATGELVNGTFEASMLIIETGD